LHIKPVLLGNLTKVQKVSVVGPTEGHENPERRLTMKYLTASLAGVLALGLATAGLAATGEFDDMCAMGLATEQKVETDCSVNATYEGKTYCFGNEAAKEKFMENPEENLAKAKEYYEEEVEG